jgi:FlgD Ig-like domain
MFNPLPRFKQKVATPAALLALLVLLVNPLSSVRQALAQSDANTVMRGFPSVGMRGIPRTTADIMFETDMVGGLPHVMQDKVEHDFEEIRANIKNNPNSPAVASIPARAPHELVRMPDKQGGGAFSPQSVGVNFTAATLATTGSFPPDNDGAVGPTQYICAVNGRIISFNKTTGVADGVLNATTNAFFATVRNASGTSDPMVRYDRLSNRWFVSIINVATPNRWCLAVSDAASNGVISATTVWTYYFFVPATIAPAISNGTTCLTDYPSLGVDEDAIYMAGDQFCGTGQPFQQVDAFVIRKSSVLSGGPLVVTAFRGLMTAAGGFVGPFAPRGVDNQDLNTNEGYFIGTDGASYGTFWIHRVSDPGGTPTLSAGFALTTPTTAGPRPVPHPGNTGGYWGRLDPLDDRPFHAVIRNQQLWTSHNIGVDNTGVSTGVYLNDTRVGARWYQINVPVGSGDPSIVQAGTVFTASATNDSTSKNFFIPSINVSGQGHAAMGFSTAGELDNANMGSVGRLASDPLGTMQTPVSITNNTNTYNPTSDPGGATAGRPRRWGDYSITSVDPLDDMSMWTVQEFCDANNSYGVRVAKLVAPPPATPNAMASIVAAQASTSATVTGVSTSGSGFFDPGPNLPAPARAFNHISATCTAGSATGTPPTVTSVSYTNATTITVTFNTSAATPNLPGEFYTLNVTNPDGQTSSAAIVRVLPAEATLTASAGAGGSISPAGATIVTYGLSQTYTITPDACYTIADVLVDGVSVGAVSSYTFNNINANHTIAASFLAGLGNPVTGLSVQQMKTGNTGGTTGIKVQYTAPVGASTVEVWRKGFGGYPQYSGSVPTAPASYPPVGWTLASAVSASGDVDVPASRDFYYYVAYGRDACGNASPVSAVAGGVLGYHLGDVSDGVTAGQGDATVNTADASLLGAHYGATGASLSGFEYLDVGPTTNNTTNGRPTPDGAVNFEDLILFSLNYAPKVSGPAAGIRPAAAAALGEAIEFRAPAVVEEGESFEVPVTLTAGGRLQGLSVAFDWDHSVVEIEGVTPGTFVASQGGVVMSSGAGRVDAAMLGLGAQGLAGEGTLATVRFRVIGSGDPRITVARVVGRDRDNRDLAVAVRGTDAFVTAAPTRTDLFPVVPNPTRGSAAIRYSLTQRGRVHVALFSVDGRLVKTLAKGVQDAGQYQLMWDGTDAQGSLTKPGMYYVRFETDGVRRSRVVSVNR